MDQNKIVRNLLSWFRRNARDLPWRRTSDPYAIWVSEIMLQQTQVKTVTPYWERWMRELPNLHDLANARPQKIHKLWEGLGYYSRVRNMQKSAKLIIERHGGRFPKEFEELMELPGIGRYTAGAICSIAFNQPKPILDGNVVRVLTRLFSIAQNPREKATNARLWTIAEELVVRASNNANASLPRSPNQKRRKIEEKYENEDERNTHHALVAPKSDGGGSPPCSSFNQSLMELGALVCTPKAPRCRICPLANQCLAYREDRVAKLPNLRPRLPATSRRFIAFVAEDHGRFLVRQRPAGIVNAHFWEFPNMEVSRGNGSLKRSAGRALRLKSLTVQPLFSIRHVITRYRIALEVVRVTANASGAVTGLAGRWVTRKQLERLPFVSAHRRILQRLDGYISK